MSENEHIAAHDDMNKAFDDGSIFESTPLEIERYLAALGTINIQSDQVRVKAIIRSLILNHLQINKVIIDLRAAIEKLNEENGKVARLVLILALVSAVCGIIQGWGVIWMIFYSH